MGRPKKNAGAAAAPAGGEEPKKVVLVKAKTAFDWRKLLENAAAQHWRTLRVVVDVRGRLMAGKPAQLDAAKAMLKARGLEDQIEAVPIDDPNKRAEAAAQVQDEGLCEFHRREGREGIWMPSNNLKAGIKENWSVLGYRVELRGSRGRIAETLFVYGVPAGGAQAAPDERDWIYLGVKPDGIETAVSHTTGPSGPVSAIKRHEYVVRPRVTFDVSISREGLMEIPDEKLASMFVHFGEHGMGACRSQGAGRFNVVSIEEIDTIVPVETAAAA